MSGFSGYIESGLTLGIESILMRPTRGLYNITFPDNTIMTDIIADAVIEERHHDELEITDHPVQQGADITDNAFKRPAEVTLHIGWSNSPTSSGSLINPLIAAAANQNTGISQVANVVGAARGVIGLTSAINGSQINQINAIYQQLLQLQSRRALFTLYTGKRIYKNMLCKSLVTETDYKTEHSLPITMQCRQIILVNSQTVMLPKYAQKTPEQTASIVNKGKITVKKVMEGWK